MKIDRTTATHAAIYTVLTLAIGVLYVRTDPRRQQAPAPSAAPPYALRAAPANMPLPAACVMACAVLKRAGCNADCAALDERRCATIANVTTRDQATTLGVSCSP